MVALFWSSCKAARYLPWNKQLKALEFCRRFVIVVQAEQQVGKRLGVVRLDVDRVAIRRNCLIVLALIPEHITEVGISLGQVRFNVTWRYAATASSSLPWSSSATPRFE